MLYAVNYCYVFVLIRIIIYNVPQQACMETSQQHVTVTIYIHYDVIITISVHPI